MHPDITDKGEREAGPGDLTQKSLKFTKVL